MKNYTTPLSTFKKLSTGKTVLVQIGAGALFVKVSKKDFWASCGSLTRPMVEGFTFPDGAAYVYVTNIY